MTNKIIKPSFHLTYRTDTNDPPKCIEGKPLGFIDRAQFYNLYNDPIKYVRKLLSCGPKSLKEIADYKYPYIKLVGTSPATTQKGKYQLYAIRKND